MGRTGRQFLGEAFDKAPQQNFTAFIPGFIVSEIINLRSSVAARSFISSSTFTVSVNNSPVIIHSLGTVGTGYEDPFFYPGVTSKDFSSSIAALTVTYKYSLPPGGSNGWLDYFELNTKASLTWESSQALFRFLPSVTPGNTAYEIANSTNNARYFNVTNQAMVNELLATTNASKSTIVNNTLTYTEIAGFNDLSLFYTPGFAGKMANQNLHNLPQADALYITPAAFYNEAMRLAAYHAQQGIKTHVVKVNEIYNEFSSGSQDISAIRDFIRMFYQRSTSQADAIKYVTFFGRASYDYKNRITNNSNFVPTYESWPSSSPGGSYCSDDYFAFLDDTEGRWETSGDVKELLDIGIGRLPVSNEREAASAVDKIINYNRPEKMGNWRNKIVFISDDEDSNLHQSDANFMADNIINNQKNYNVEKIWIDAYKREVIAGGQRYPDAQKAINEAIQKGTFIVNYTGHGGELGWAAERILTLEDIASWTNINQLPLFVTATCEFSRYDDPGRVSAGELTFLSTKGGAIALLSTSRLVGATENTLLNKSFYNVCGLDSTSKIAPKPLGTIMMQTKNNYGGNGNERNFTLIGDAVTTLAYPKLNVITTAINNLPLANITDTLKALSKVTINGAVTDMSGQIQVNYNGEVFPIVYDKPSTYQTLVNSPKSSPALNFVMQNNIIYKGSASVKNGLFSFSFIV
ncbi:MAG: type IX secretion system sortase PorU, partial [Bacteroidota bacterium]